ncbi:MAG: DNA helicase RecQ [Anaerolineales bacterium]|uniref:DNA helicase RecQ n=1 Tax=Candidatus Villigracilis proximus TaxID=3140683 RepID=UPI0031366B08|nr:DNA helicase RecQ [Anaerolineales bacterium]
MPTPETILKSTFGYDTFKPLQREIITNVQARRDTLVIMATGGSKSLTYQVPALMFSGLTVVVSPLIALMKDQVEQLRALGVPALFINSSLSPEEYQGNMDAVRRGEIKLLYVAPETLLTPRIFSLLSSLKLDLLAIDEAHCISEWGHDFRPEYRQLAEVRKKFPSAVCMALTATATPRVRADIMSTLGFSQANEFQSSFNRENLFIEVRPKREGVAQTLRFLENFKDQSGIIYCFSRRQVDELSDAIARHGFSVRPYHAGLEDSERRRNQEAFIRDDVQIIVATIAFGMGINKPNVRFVIHFDLPKNIESYYQEIGRAGRDGLPSHCLLLYTYADVNKIRYFIDQKDDPERSTSMQHLDAMTRYAEGSICRRKPLLAYFGETFVNENCGACDNCGTEQTAQVDITIPAQKFLSCVKRSGERFGAAHVVDILLGSKNEKIEKYNHHELSTYGIGKELTKSQWMHISRQLVERGLLEQEPAYRVLSVTAKGLEMLKSREQVKGVVLSGSKDQINEAQKKERGARVKSSEFEYDRSLFSQLRNKRKELADEAGLPPYVIFSDKTLVEMAGYFPQSQESLLNISGVGKVKFERYGAAFLAIIKEYCRSNKIDEKYKAPAREADKDAGRRYITVGEAYNAGESIQSLMKRYAVTADTILNHLARFILAGNPLRSAEDLIALSNLSPDQQMAVFKAFDTMGSDALKPVYEKFNNTISYDELRILRLCYLCEER